MKKTTTELPASLIALDGETGLLRTALDDFQDPVFTQIDSKGRKRAVKGFPVADFYLRQKHHPKYRLDERMAFVEAFQTHIDGAFSLRLLTPESRKQAARLCQSILWPFDADVFYGVLVESARALLAIAEHDYPQLVSELTPFAKGTGLSDTPWGLGWLLYWAAGLAYLATEKTPEPIEERDSPEKDVALFWQYMKGLHRDREYFRQMARDYAFPQYDGESESDWLTRFHERFMQRITHVKQMVGHSRARGRPRGSHQLI